MKYFSHIFLRGFIFSISLILTSEFCSLASDQTTNNSDIIVDEGGSLTWDSNNTATIQTDRNKTSLSVNTGITGELATNSGSDITITLSADSNVSGSGMFLITNGTDTGNTFRIADSAGVEKINLAAGTGSRDWGTFILVQTSSTAGNSSTVIENEIVVNGIDTSGATQQNRGTLVLQNYNEQTEDGSGSARDHTIQLSTVTLQGLSDDAARIEIEDQGTGKTIASIDKVVVNAASAGASRYGTIAMQSDLAGSATIATADITGSGTNDANLLLRGSNGKLVLTNVNLKGATNVDDSVVHIQSAWYASITNLNVSSGNYGTLNDEGSANITNTNIDGTLKVINGAALGSVSLAGTIDNDTALSSISTLDITGNSATINGSGAVTVSGATTEIDNNLQISGSGVKTFTNGVDIQSGSEFSVYTSALHSLGAVEISGGTLSILADAAQASLTGTGLTIDPTGSGTISVAENKTYNTGGSTLGAGATLNLSGSGTVNLGAVNTASNRTINVGAGTIAGFGAADLSGSKVVLNLGSDSTAAAGSYATLTGVNNLTLSNTVSGGTTTVVELFGLNGVANLTYSNVLDADNANIQSGYILNTEDSVRIYTVAANLRDIEVTSNKGREAEIVTQGGGSGVAAKAGQWMVDNQSGMNTAGQTFVTNFTNLPTAQNARAVQEVIGEGTTFYVDQAAMNSIQGGNRAIGQQMTSFRSGNIAAGMASSFGSGGATAALNEMADADDLASAYETGFTSSSDDTQYKKMNIWVNSFGGFGEQGSIDYNVGYDFWNAGAVVGFDYAVAQEIRFGALLSYSHSKATRYQSLGNSSDNTIGFGGYGSFNWDKFFVDAQTQMGIHMIKSFRNVFDGSTAKGERTGINVNTGATVGYTFSLPAELQLTPEYSLNYTMFYDPDFTESGAGASNTHYNSFTSNSLLQNLGLRTGKLIKSSENLTFLPEIWGGWEVEYLNTGGYRNTTTSASLGGQSYSTVMNGMAAQRGYWGAGITALIGNNVSVYGRYDHKIWHKGFTASFSSGIKISF